MCSFVVPYVRKHKKRLAFGYTAFRIKKRRNQTNDSIHENQDWKREPGYYFSCKVPGKQEKLSVHVDAVLYWGNNAGRRGHYRDEKKTKFRAQMGEIQYISHFNLDKIQ